MKVLVINAGSSSCKYQLLEMDTETVLASGLAERIGQGMGKLTHKIAPDSDHEEKIVRESAFPTHVEAMELVISLLTDHRPPRAARRRIHHRDREGGRKREADHP